MPAVNYWWLHLKPILEIDGTGITKLGTISSGVWQGNAIQDAYVANNITLTNITQITTRSHASLSAIGTNSHTQIDTHIGAANPHAGSAPSAHSHLDAEVDNGITLTNITQITTKSHTSLSDIGSNAHSVIDTHLGAANPHSGSAPSAHSHLDAEVDNGITLTNITQITTKSHTSLSDIGSNAHSVIDTHLGAANPHSGSAPSAHSHLDAEVDNGITLTNITQITTKSHTSLSDIGTNNHAAIDVHLAKTTDPHGSILTQTNLILGSGATVSDIDTVMPASPTDSQLLTSQGIQQYASNRVAPIGTVEYNGSGRVIALQPYRGDGGLYMPASDTDCCGCWQFVLPAGAKGTFYLEIYFQTSAAGPYQGLLSVSCYSDEEIPSGGNNCYSDSNLHLTGEASNEFERTVVSLTGGAHAPVGGDNVGVLFESDTSNAMYLVITGVYIYWSG